MKKPNIFLREQNLNWQYKLGDTTLLELFNKYYFTEVLGIKLKTLMWCTKRNEKHYEGDIIEVKDVVFDNENVTITDIDNNTLNTNEYNVII